MLNRLKFKRYENDAGIFVKVVLQCTVLHKVSDVPDMINEIRRILVKGGVLSIIEFHKRETPMGPPIERRLDSMQLEEILHITDYM